MKFSVKQYVADANLTPFEFEDINGDPQELPNLLTLTAGDATRIMTMLDADPIAAIAEFNPVLGEAVKATPLLALHALVTAWVAHGEVESGKSPASSRSSKATARTSRPTSRATTKAPTRKR